MSDVPRNDDLLAQLLARIQDGQEAATDEVNLAIALVGGLITVASGLGMLFIGPVAAATTVAGLGIATFSAYVGKVVYDVLSTTPTDHLLRRIDEEVDRLEVRLVELYDSYRYGWNPLYTKEEFAARRHQLHLVFDQAAQIDELFDQPGMGETARRMIMPDIDKLIQLSVRLYQRRLFLLGQLFAVSIGDNSVVTQAQDDVARLERELEEAGRDRELLAVRQTALTAARRHLESVRAGVNSPEALARQIELTEAQFDEARLTVAQQLERLSAQVNAMATGMQSADEAAAGASLRETVESLLATEKAQNTVASWIGGGTSTPAVDQAEDVSLGAVDLTAQVPGAAASPLREVSAPNRTRRTTKN